MPSRTGRTLGAAAALLVATVVAAVVAIVVVSRHHAARPAAHEVAAATAQQVERPVASDLPGLPAAVREAAAWMGRELPHGATVSAPADAAALLRRSGFEVSAASSSYVLVGSVSAFPGALPVAEFHAGGAAATVLQRVASVPHSVTARRAADAASRRSAERELLGNQRLHASAGARAVLARGGLDLRPAAVLALLAARGPVSVVEVRIDPPEQAAGLPARAVDLRVATAVADAVRRQLPAGFRPASVAALPGGLQRWTWPLRAVPMAPTTP